MSRFVIKTVQSGVPGLSEQLPAAGYTIDMWTDSRGATTFHAVLETPLRFHLGPGIDTDRLDANRFDRDSAGPFVWVTEVIMAPHHADQQPHPGMTDFAMDVAAVLPPSDADTASPEVSTIGLGVVDDAPEPSGPARTEEVDEGGLPSTANLDPPLIDIASAHQDPGRYPSQRGRHTADR